MGPSKSSPAKTVTMGNFSLPSHSNVACIKSIPKNTPQGGGRVEEGVAHGKKNKGGPEKGAVGRARGGGQKGLVFGSV